MTRELADRLAADLEDAFPVLVRTHQAAVFATAVQLRGHWQDAEETAQETFVAAYRALSGWPPERIRELRVRPWLLRICLNTVRNQVRSERRRPAQAPLEAGSQAVDPARTPEEEAARRVGREHLAAALAELPDIYRRPVVLRHVTGLAYDEIAEVLGLPPGTVKAQVHRGVRLLAERVQPQIVEMVR